MTAEPSYLLAFASGLFGAFHCLGMCGGIAGGFFYLSRGPWLWSQIAYHGSRILGYLTLGMSGFWLGRVLVQTGLFGRGQGLWLIAAGVAVVILGGLHGYRLFRSKPAPDSPAASARVALTRRSGWLAPLLAGWVNALVPCSLVFGVAIKTLAMSSWLEAATMMLAFGLGTLPANLAVTLTAAILRKRAGRYLSLAAAGTVVGLGLWTIYEGWVFYDVMRGLAP